MAGVPRQRPGDEAIQLRSKDSSGTPYIAICLTRSIGPASVPPAPPIVIALLPTS